MARKHLYTQGWILGEASEAVASGPPYLQLPRGPFLKMLCVCGNLHGFINFKNSQKFGAFNT